jgi:hypothetical protein
MVREEPLQRFDGVVGRDELVQRFVGMLLCAGYS